MRWRRTMNRTRQAASLAILGLVSIGALSWVPSSHSQMLPATVPAATARAAMPTNPTAETGLKAAYGRLPLSFEENRGQTDEAVRFLSRGEGYTLFLTQGEAVLALRRSPNSGSNKSSPSNAQPSESSALRLKLVGANTHAQVMGLEELSSKSNYFIGNDPKKWRTNVPSYARVRYSEIYPGVDLVYYGNQSGQLEYDFVVAPGADPKAIALNIEQELAASERASEAAPLRLDRNGDLVLHTGAGVRFQKPVVYQQDGQGRRHYIDGHYLLQIADSKIGNPTSRVSFEVAAYDHSKPLIIDPAIVYSTYLRGPSSPYINGNSIAAGVAVFADPVTGHVYAYVAGRTCASDFPTVNAAQPTYGGGCSSSGYAHGDAFVAKFDPSASGTVSLIYSTYLGGSGSDSAAGIAVDSAGNAYVTGGTSSSNFPWTANAYQTTNKAFPRSNAFLAKLSPDGQPLLYSSYLGGQSGDIGHAIAVNGAGLAYIAGSKTSTNFPTINPYQASFVGCGNPNAFAAISDTTQANTASLVYATYLGGAGPKCDGTGDLANGIAVDTAGAIYFAGSTTSPNFPIKNAYQTTLSYGHGNAFLAKLNPSASGSAQLVYSTFLGGTGDSWASAVAADSAGNVYLTGGEGPPNDFPVTAGAFKTTTSGMGTAWVAKLDPSQVGSASLVYATLLGGSGDPYVGGDWGAGIVVDANGNAFITGVSSSVDFPLVNPVLGSSNGVMQSVNGGTSWTLGYTGLPGKGIVALAVDSSTSPRTLYAAGFAGQGVDAVFKSTDGGLNWNQVLQLQNADQTCIASLTPCSIFTMAVDPTIPSNVYVGTSQGVFKSSDRGTTWSPFNTGLSSTAVQGVRGLFFDGGTLYSGAGDGLYKLSAGASSWTSTTLGADVRSIAIAAPHTIYTASVAASTGYRSTDGGATWTPINDPYGNLSTIAVDPSTSPATLYGVDNDGTDVGLGLWASTDGGNTWNPLPDPGLSGQGYPDAEFHLDTATSPSTLYVRDSGNGIFKSTNGGDNWTSVLVAPMGSLAIDTTTA